MMDQIIPLISSSIFTILFMEVDEDTSSSSDDEGEEIVFQVLNCTKNLEKERICRISNYVEKTVAGYSNLQFQQHFRVSRRSYEYLLEKIGPALQRKGSTGRETINIEKQILSTIWLMATPDSYRSVSDRFNLGKSSLSVSFFRVVEALCNIAIEEITWPRGNRINTIKESFKAMANLDNIIGAIDGTYIQIKAPKKDPEVYVTRKCNYAITLQAVCDSGLLFTDIFVGYPGSVSDTRIFRNSDLFISVVSNVETYFPNQEFIIGDKAYPLTTWCIPPYIEHVRLGRVEHNFNTAHAKTRQVIERAFALLFGRFRRLKFLDMNAHHLIPQVVLAACVLHNICITRNDSHIEDYVRDGYDFPSMSDEEVNDSMLIPENEASIKRNNLARELQRIIS